MTTTTLDQCACDVPSKANWYVHIVLSRKIPGGTETSYRDLYLCAGHMVEDPHSLVRTSDSEEWRILESTVAELR